MEKNHHRKQKSDKYIINVSNWKNNVLNVIEIIADSFKDAKDYLTTIKDDNTKIKIIDKNKKMVYSETLNHKKNGHNHHGQGHHHGHNPYH